MNTTKRKIACITNIPSPYNVDLFWFLNQYSSQYKFFPVYTNDTEDNRKWEADKNRLENSVILHSRVIKLKTALDQRYIHIPPSLEPTLNEIDPEAVIAWEYNIAALQAMHWCKKHHRKFIHVTEGTLHSERDLNAVQKWSRKRIIRHADGWIATSTKAKEKLVYWEAPQDKIFTALLTVDITSFLKQDYSPIPGRILYVGSFAKRKGLDLLFEALPYIKEPYELHIVGDGDQSEKKQLQQILERTGSADNVKWIGYREGESLRKEYREAAVFVLPTREDCFGLVLAEALAAGNWIVSSKYADGAYDVVKPGMNGVIIDPENAKEFAEAICSALPFAEDRRSENEEIINSFRYETIAKHYYECLNVTLSDSKNE